MGKFNVTGVTGEYFFGNKISNYGLEHGYVDYATLAKSFDHIMANDLMSQLNGVVGYFEPCCGSEEYYEYDGNDYTLDDLDNEIENLEDKINDPSEGDDIEELERQLEEMNEARDNPYYREIYQYFIIDSRGAEILAEWTDEVVFYNEALNMYVWGVTHWGTSWDYVLTDIPCNTEKEGN